MEKSVSAVLQKYLRVGVEFPESKWLLPNSPPIAAPAESSSMWSGRGLNVPERLKKTGGECKEYGCGPNYVIRSQKKNSSGP